jgi:hypothetical protein
VAIETPFTFSTKTYYVFYKNVLRFLQKRMTKGVTNETPFPFFTKMDEREGSREV